MATITLEALEYRLSDLAAKWRKVKNTQDEQSVVEQYQDTLRRLISMGFSEELDVDAELPDRLMPREYLDLFR